MNEERFRKVQEFLDGGGNSGDRRETEEWIQQDSEASELRSKLELQGELLREWVDESLQGEEVSLWESIEDELKSVNPAWKRKLEGKVEPVPGVQEESPAPAPEVAPFRGWLALALAMMAMLVVWQFMGSVQPTATSTQETGGNQAGVVQPEQEEEFEIEHMESEDATVMVYTPAEKAAPIIWIQENTE